MNSNTGSLLLPSCLVRQMFVCYRVHADRQRHTDHADFLFSIRIAPKVKFNKEIERKKQTKATVLIHTSSSYIFPPFSGPLFR